MNKFKEIKTMLTNKEVVTRYLGTPIKTTSTGIWYKSPFRSERTASFCVSNKGIHDFGDSTHYDIISFVEKYFNTSPNKALEILCYDFNISIGNEYETKEILANIKRKREIINSIIEDGSNIKLASLEQCGEERVVKLALDTNDSVIKLVDSKPVIAFNSTIWC